MAWISFYIAAHCNISMECETISLLLLLLFAKITDEQQNYLLKTNVLAEIAGYVQCERR